MITPIPAALTVPFTFTTLGAVAITPPVKLNTSLPLPKVTLPVFLKVVMPAIVLALPSRDTLKALAPAPALTVIPVVTVTLSLKAMLAASVVSVKVTVAALTVLLNVVPPDWVIVTIPISVPIASLTVTTPVLLIIKLETVPPEVPVIAAKLIGLAMPVPTVNVTPSAKVAAPNVI